MAEDPTAGETAQTTDEERHHPFRDLVVEAALEAERETGRHETTDEDARHSASRRLGRLILGWVLVLIGIAGLPLPGPGWLIIILGLSLLPYVWAERTIRLIRQRIPGIPEDGRIPTRTWIIMGAAVAASLGVSIWWGLRDDDPEPGAAAEVRSSVIWDQATEGSGAARIYGSVIEATTNHEITYAPLDPPLDPLAGIEDGTIDGGLIPVTQLISSVGAADEADARGRLERRKLKAFAPVTIDGVDYWPVVDTTEFAKDDEELENAIDGVSGLINDGAGVAGNPDRTAKAMLADLGLTK